MTRDELRLLHYIAPLANLSSILEHGILCFERTRALPHDSFAMETIQERRVARPIPQGRPIHQYANLYFNARNPTMFRRVREGMTHRLCVVEVSTDVLDLPEVVIVDRNASSDHRRCATSPAGIELIRADRVYAKDWRHPGDEIAYWKHRSEMCAEVLVPEAIPTAFLLDVRVAGTEGEASARAAGCQLPIVRDPELFFVQGEP